jgi:hypothetical protein
LLLGRATKGRFYIALHNGETGMTAYKMTYLVDKLAMTGVNMVLLAALPLSVALIIAQVL